MNVEPLIRAIISAMMLLEHSDPDEVDPDTAVKGMENMGHELLKLNAGDRLAFLTVLEGIAESENDGSVADFVRSMPFMLGFAS